MARFQAVGLVPTAATAIAEPVDKVAPALGGIASSSFVQQEPTFPSSQGAHNPGTTMGQTALWIATALALTSCVTGQISLPCSLNLIGPSDVIFLLDASASVLESDFNHVTRLIEEDFIARAISIGNATSDSRVAVIIHDTGALAPRRAFDLFTQSDVPECVLFAREGIWETNVTYKRGEDRTGDENTASANEDNADQLKTSKSAGLIAALKDAENLLNSVQRRSSRFLFVATNLQLPLDQMDAIKQAIEHLQGNYTVKVYGIGVGVYNKMTFNDLVSSRSENCDVRSVKGWSDFLQKPDSQIVLRKDSPDHYIVVDKRLCCTLCSKFLANSSSSCECLAHAHHVHPGHNLTCEAVTGDTCLAGLTGYAPSSKVTTIAASVVVAVVVLVVIVLAVLIWKGILLPKKCSRSAPLESEPAVTDQRCQYKNVPLESLPTATSSPTQVDPLGSGMVKYANTHPEQSEEETMLEDAIYEEIPDIESVYQKLCSVAKGEDKGPSVIPQLQILEASDIVVGDVIYRGTLNTVVKAKYGDRDVTIKSISDNREMDKRVREIWMSEVITLLTAGSHPNILPPMAMTTTHGLGCMLFPLSQRGNLESYLRASNGSVEYNNLTNGLPYDALFRLSEDIATGMTYVHSQQLLHPCLRAQEVYIGEDNLAKISGFLNKDDAIAKLVMEGERNTLPVRWLGPEVVKDCTLLDEKSDVWSYGIVLWEIFTLGIMPYQGMNAVDINMFLSQGRVLPKPEMCSTKVFDLMKRCWVETVKFRLTFDQVLDFLHEIKDA